MEVYLLKASAILVLFLLVYQALLRRETFFRINRFFLLSGIGAALLLPLITIREEIVVPLEMMAQQTLSPAETKAGFVTDTGWESLFLLAYLTGVLFLLARTGRQLLEVFRLMKSPYKIRKDGVVLRPTAQTEAPFSFLNHIFYHPELHNEEELHQILEHEKVHARQWHTLDILLARVATLVLWLNPLAWWYQKIIQENLEFLADAGAIQNLPSRREYQYTLLKVSGNAPPTSLVNSFNSPILKKRIVMLHQTPSKSVHMLKYLLILPVLALFLMAFNRETVYLPQATSPQQDKTIEVIIENNTTDSELLEIKEYFKKDNVDFSYTVVRNEAGEIVDISFDFNGKAKNGNPFSGSYSCVCEGPIKPILIRITANGGVYFGEVEAQKEGSSEDENSTDQAKVWIYESGNQDSDTLEIRKVNGREVIILAGEETDREALSREGNARNIFVKILETDDNPDVEVQIHKIEVEEDGEVERIIEIAPEGDEKARYKTIVVEADKNADIRNKDAKFSFYQKGKHPGIFIDGKKASQKEMDRLNPDQIESINVLKGEASLKKYGKKAADGVIEITTKKQ